MNRLGTYKNNSAPRISAREQAERTWATLTGTARPADKVTQTRAAEPQGLELRRRGQ